MDSTILQVPLSKSLRNQALSTALEDGFSSLQDAVRLFLSKYSSKSLTLNFETPAVKLSKRAEKRYMKMEEDFKLGRNVHHAKDVDDFLRQLHA